LHGDNLVLERLAHLALLEQSELHLLEPSQRAVRRGEVDALADLALVDDDAAELARLRPCTTEAATTCEPRGHDAAELGLRVKVKVEW